MTTHVHFPLSRFVFVHPYVTEWLMLAAITLTAVLLWFWNS
jgi:hypothetical protein